MVDTRSLALAFSALLVVAAASPLTRVRARRQLADDNSLQPIEDAEGDEQTREKRKFEGVTQAKFGIKNAVLGFVFGDGITSRRQVKSTSPERVSLLPTSNTGDNINTNTLSIANDNWATLNENTRGPSNENRGPYNENLRGITNKLTRGTADKVTRGEPNTGATYDTRGPLKSPTSSNTKVSSISSSRGSRQADDIPVFDRNKVSLDFPGALFGPSLSLLIRTTKIVGDVIQNSAVRYQSFLRLFRPLFRGQFEIKGLDPATTTTTTTTTTTKAPVAADNEVRR